MMLVENMIGALRVAENADLAQREENANMVILKLSDILSLIHAKLPVSIFNAYFISLVKKASPQEYLIEIYANDIAEKNTSRFYHLFSYNAYAGDNKAYKSPVFETIISEKERQKLISYFVKSLKAIAKTATSKG
jgi:hypothetical protein